ncbi:M20/M25/M40 family metallo-hydrolase [Desulfosporosinus sp. Sb-LF]|uniref:M28 family metallopeptidase n=1 Tax=Desulfosporosinus sp. Sb-LF TaxID=2560027 RepID=UPI00107F38D6|nr:M20/M25/M40 family metallo-hydrolase [Desulfosporosinus sp. Sb-LF]TGE32383.1 Zn-dependent exopeptidase M28 [Desulfosporosinus sp. Sb-LF]
MKFFKTSVIILVAILCLMVISWQVYTNTRISYPNGVTSSFSAAKAYEHVTYLAQKIGPRPAGSKSELKAAQYISYVLNQNGWKVHEQPFSKAVARETSVIQREQQVELINSQNIIAELPGNRPDTIVVGAHYDSASLNAPGAVDNASGVGVLLELARVLSQEPHEDTYQFIFFGAEEYGLVGSQFYTTQADLSAVRWMLNVDMVGTPLEIDVAGKKSTPPELIKQVVALAGESHISFHLSRDSILMARESTQGGASDFSSFLDKRIPALGLGISGRPAGYFHRPEDRLDRVSMEEMKKVGDYAHRLLTNVKLEKLGPHVWDELYLPFQIGKNVFILPNYGILIFTFFTFIVTVFLLIQFLRKNSNKHILDWKGILGILGVTIVLSLIVVGLSGIGEILWSWIKQVKLLYYAYPTLFVLARIGIALGILIILASWIDKLPLARDPHLYWFIGVIFLLGVSLLLALSRIDLAFPFVFWLLCFDLQIFLPNIILVVLGPYFIYCLHFELLNSQQWVSFYEAIHKYPLIFLGIYGLLLVPFFLACLHVVITKKELVKKIVYHTQKPALAVTCLVVLFLGLIPTYTKDYQQAVTVREEWSGSSEGLVHIFSSERLPNQLVKDLSGQEGKSLYVPILNVSPPLIVNTSVVEKNKNSERTLEISIKLNYSSEPYLVRLHLEGPKPFEVQTDEFLPMSKIPKKFQLKGVQQSSGNYSIILQRTPPQRNTIHLSIETQSEITCSIEAMFPDTSPRIQIQHALVSPDYQIQFKESYDF